MRSVDPTVSIQGNASGGIPPLAARRIAELDATAAERMRGIGGKAKRDGEGRIVLAPVRNTEAFHATVLNALTDKPRTAAEVAGEIGSTPIRVAVAASRLAKAGMAKRLRSRGGASFWAATGTPAAEGMIKRGQDLLAEQRVALDAVAILDTLRRDGATTARKLRGKHRTAKRITAALAELKRVGSVVGITRKGDGALLWSAT